MHSGERKMLYRLLDADEKIIALVGGTYRAEQDTNRMHKHRGVAVATSKRVIFLDKGVFGSEEVSQMLYTSAEGVTDSTGMMRGGVQIIGMGGSGWRIEDVRPRESAGRSADRVRELAQQIREGADRTAVTGSVADEISKLADLLDRGILTQQEFEVGKQRLLERQ